jgi:PAS domain S-box-containing protein
LRRVSLGTHEESAFKVDLERLFALSQDILCVSSSDGFFKIVSPAFTQVLGWTEQELLSTPYIDLVHPEDVPATLLEVERQVLAGEKVLLFENRYLHKRGDWRILSWKSVPQPGGIMYATARDVTSQREAEARLHELHVAIEQHASDLEQRVAERTRELTQARHEAIDALAQACEFRDDDTGHHTERVGEMSARIARAMGEPKKFVAKLQLAAPLHDVGKIGIPDAVLLKPGKFTDEEMEVMRQHTTIGAKVFERSVSPFMLLAREIALCHHERWDGSGYPNGLRGADIPLAARIVAVADVYDALTHERPYKRAWSSAEAIEEIAAQSGKHFDPRVVDAFLQVVEADELPLAA